MPVHIRVSSGQPLTAAQQGLAASHLPMARELAAIAANGKPHLAQELESDACLALVEAARSFRDDGPCCFTTYSFRAIGWKLRKTERRERLRGYKGRSCCRVRILSLEAAPQTALRIAADPPGAAVEHHEQFEHMIRGLPEPQRNLMRLVFVDGLGLADVGRRLGVSREAARLLYCRAVKAIGGSHTAFPSHLLR